MDMFLRKQKIMALARQQVAPFNKYSACRLSLAVGVLCNIIFCTWYGCGAVTSCSFFFMGTCFGGGMKVFAMALEECKWFDHQLRSFFWATKRD